MKVSSVQFRQQDFVEVVLRVLEETGLAAGRLEVEVTESVVMQGAKSVIQKRCILNAAALLALRALVAKSFSHHNLKDLLFPDVPHDAFEDETENKRQYPNV